jgi:hypothetical protein
MYFESIKNHFTMIYLVPLYVYVENTRKMQNLHLNVIFMQKKRKKHPSQRLVKDAFCIY